MTVLLYVLLIGFFCVLMIKATDMLMAGVRTVMVSAHSDAYGVATFLLAFSTSLPELMVGVSAGLQQEPTLALGNVLGSNIANLSLVLGGAALVSGLLKASDAFLHREVFYVFLAGAMPLVLLLDGSLTRLDGIVLLLVYLVYNLTVMDRKRERLATHELHEMPLWQRILTRVTHAHVQRGVGMLAAGGILMIVAADMIVRLGSQLAMVLNVPAILVGLFVVGIGTSLPELFFEIVAIRKHEVAMAFGNILGSVVTNSTLVMGVTVMFAELRLEQGMVDYLMATLAFIGAFFLFWLFVWSKHQLERWEGAVLVLFYVVFMLAELIRQGG